MRMEARIMNSFGLKAHNVVKVEELPEGGLVAHGKRLGSRTLRCGECRLHPRMSPKDASFVRPSHEVAVYRTHPLLTAARSCLFPYTSWGRSPSNPSKLLAPKRGRPPVISRIVRAGRPDCPPCNRRSKEARSS